MAKGFIALFYLLAVVLPLIAIYVATFYVVQYSDAEFTTAGLFVDSVFSDIKSLVDVDAKISRVNATHGVLKLNSTVEKRMDMTSKNVENYRRSLERTLDSIGWNYHIDFSQLETDAPLPVYFTSGHSALIDNKDYDFTFYGTGNEEQINTTIFYDPQGNPFFRIPFSISFTPGPVEWNVVIEDNVGAPLTYSANVDPQGFNYIFIWYFSPSSFLNVWLYDPGSSPATTRVYETPTNRKGTGWINVDYLLPLENYTFAYLPGNLTINQSNIYKSPIGIVIGEG